MNLFERIVNSPKFYRFLEALPGVLSWTFIIGPIVISAFYPSVVAYFVLIYSVYWVYKSIKFVVLGYIGHKKVLFVEQQDWVAKLKSEFPGEWEKYYYCGMIPFASESIEVLRPTVESLYTSNFPNERKILCLSSEKALPKGKEVAEQLRKEFEGKFAHVFITEHELKEGEIKGKAANENHAGRFFYDKLGELGIDPANVLITSNDADMINHREYQAYLLYKFLLEGDDKHYRIYQPIPTDFTDVWNASFFSRLIISLSVQWRIALQQRDDYRTTVYSFYSMSMKTLKEIGFWDTDLIPEDERTQFNAMFTFGEKFRVIPLFMIVSGKPVQAPTFWKAFKEQYIQLRRHAWGASEFAHSFTLALKKRDVSWKVKLLPIFNQMRTSVEWTTGSILPMIGGIMPGLLNESFRTTILAYSMPTLVTLLMQMSSVLLVLIIYIEYKIAPKRPEGKGLWFKFFTFGQWFLLPYVGFALSSLPALDAQTRLIFNKRIVYVESRKEK